MRRLFRFGALVVAFQAALTLLSSGRALAAVVSMIPTADAMVSGNNATNNYGGAGALSIAAAGLANGEFQSVMRFDTSAAKSSFDGTYGAGNWTVQSVTLKLTQASPANLPGFFNGSAAGSFGVSWMQNDGWTEGTGTPNVPTTTGITYSTLSSFLGGSDENASGSLAFGGATSGTATYTLTLTPGLLADLNNGTPLSLRLFAGDSAVSDLFNSRIKGGSEPTLTVTATPEPGSMLLLLTAGGAAVAFCRLKRRAAC